MTSAAQIAIGFARLVSVKTVVTGISLAVPAVAFASALPAFLPHSETGATEIETATDAFSVATNVCTAILGVVYLRAGYVFPQTEDY